MLRRWGEFEIQIRIQFVAESGEKPIVVYHHLKLHPYPVEGGGDASAPKPTGPEGVHSWQYDEIVFVDPFQAFLNILLAHPPTPLPKAKRRLTQGVPESDSYPPEFSVALEKEEIERLEEAKRKVTEETERLRAILAEKEEALKQLKGGIPAA